MVLNNRSMRSSFFLWIAFLLCLPNSVQGFTTTDLRSSIPFSSSVTSRNPKWNSYSSHAITVPIRHTPIIALRAATTPMTSSSFLVRIVFLRAMAFVHSIAFLIALKQNKALIGDNGITPARDILNDAEERGRQKKQRRLEWRKQNYTEPSIGLFSIRQREKHFFRWIGKHVDNNPWLLRAREVLWDRSDSLDRPLTTLLWFVKDRTQLNPWLDRIALTGLLVSAFIMFLGAANVPLVLTVGIQHGRPREAE